MRRKIDVEIKAGIFVVSGLLLVAATILAMGGASSLFQKNYDVFVNMPDASGLNKGAFVRSGGLKVGEVAEIDFSEDFQNIRVTMTINEAFKNRVRENSTVRLQTQGVLGDKFLDISLGSPDREVVADGGTVQMEESKDLSAILSDGSSAVQLLKENLANLKVLTNSMVKGNNFQSLMENLNTTSANLRDFSGQMKNGDLGKELSVTLKNFRILSERIKNGEGTVGALLSDASLYEDLKHLIGGANRNNVLKFFVRQAVKSSDDAAIEEDKASEKKKSGGKKEPASTSR